MTIDTTASGPREPVSNVRHPSSNGMGKARANKKRNRPAWISGSLVAVWTIIVAFPLYFLAVTSLRQQSGYIVDGPLALPWPITFQNYVDVLTGQFMRYFANNVIVTVGAVVISVVFALFAAYAIVRSKSRLLRRFFYFMLLGLAIPAQAVIIPLYLIINELHLYDTLWAIILPAAAFGLPLAILVLVGSLRDIPGELYESMELDGATPWIAFRQLVLPLSRPAISTVTIYLALGAWNGFLFPLVLTQSQDVRVLTLGLWDFQTQFGVNIPGLTAAVTLSLVPLLVLYLFSRKQLLSGLTAGFSK
ncbi:carbohydrate ABC transporter permease [Demequina aurantiaca]|uniref:carbohydrate ABC transporter permease n=1 Tax=Demequina aurantiaca TaxID=676200 RepID=UPI0009FBE314|nr:carbohydrate ABC transporter permease [Demequina aurantiaca]